VAGIIRSVETVPLPEVVQTSSPHATATGGRQSKIVKNEIAISFLNDVEQPDSTKEQSFN